MPAPRPPTPCRAVLAQAGFQLWLLTVLLGTVLGTAWLFRLPEDLSPPTRVWVTLALLSSVVVLALIPGALFVLAHRFVRSWRWVGLVQVLVAFLFLGLLYTDTIVYRLLRYHFNSAVLNVAVTPGSGDSIHLGWEVWGLVLTTAVGGILAGYLFWRWTVAWLERRSSVGLAVPLLLRPRFVGLAFLLPVVGVEKGVFAAALLRGEREVVAASKPLPLYPRVSLGRLLDPEGGRLPQLQVVPPGSRLDYPHVAPAIPPHGPRPNLLLVVLDSWRRDAFGPERTPRLWDFAREGRVYEDHLSTGNGTRFGLFGLLYGLHGSYWFPTLEARRPPVLLEVLAELGYDVRVFSSASMNFPELRDTAWAGLPPGHVVDEFRDGLGRERSNLPWVKDGYVAEAFEDWLAARADAPRPPPFFAFVLLDAPHQPYFDPGGPHRPSVEKIDYVELGRVTEGPELAALVERVQNAYLNCVLHADATAGRLLDALEDSGELEHTVVLVTGDHGEEFQENGFWGHTSNFSPEQVAVPFTLRGPGVAAGRERRPTSHLDVSGSLLELLGAEPAQRAGYSLGESLFDPPARRARVMAGWADLGLWTEDGIFDIPVDGAKAEIEVYDADWRPLPDAAERCAAQAGALERTAEECLRFLAVPAQ